MNKDTKVVSEDEINGCFSIGLNILDREYKFGEWSKHRVIEEVDKIKYELLKKLRPLRQALGSVQHSGIAAGDPLVEEPSEVKPQSLEPEKVILSKGGIKGKRLYTNAERA